MVAFLPTGQDFPLERKIHDQSCQVLDYLLHVVMVSTWKQHETILM
jgi:hypothetical protein